ncbi:MAG: Ig-like domain-containing protein, partial [candidate division KSB1 bacterium]|nr:Ig-like domain-containing protein [candidate division KSB1 bacterium]
MEKGGFITGHVYDSQNKRPLSRIDIGFVHQDSGTAQSYVTSQEDGSYISPGLPIGSYIVRAGSAPYNYILEFYNNTREQEQAQLIQVTTSDTVKGIDFYLEKGGAISGQVLEEDGVTPIPHAWVVVLREDGSWVLDIHSKADGSYVVSGLDSGKYFVQVYSVDPSRYHPEYYHDSPRLTDATPVPVTIPDTTKGIDFRLTKVVTASISNPFIEVTVCDKYPGTNLTMKNTGGLPQTSVDDEKDLLFGHPYPYTSYTTIRVDDENYIYGSNEGDLVVPPQVSSDQKFITRVWRVKNLEVAQTVSLDSSVWSLNKFEDTAKLQYTIVNRDNISHAVGIRILLDTMLGSNDGAPIMIPYSEYSDYERDFQAPNIPFWWTAIDGRPDHIIFSAQGTLRDYGATTPDRFVTAKWSNIYKHKWDYKISDTTKVIYDSAVALWWEPIALAPGASREIVTYYGLGEGIPDTVAPYLDNLHPAKNAVEVPIDTDILLHLKDSQSGVDTTTIVMTVDGARVVPKISGTPKDIILKYEPPENFKYNQRVTVGIAGVKDLAVKPNVMNPESYTFSIRQDTTAPYLSELNPAAGQRNVPLDVKMVAHIKDNLSGVDQNTIVMLLNDQQVIPQSITGDSSDYVLTYQPDKPFRYRDSVKVTIQAQDLALPHDGKTNRLEAYYTF